MGTVGVSGLGRIWFHGNPWPEGHPLAEAELSGLLTDHGVRLLLHVRSAEYSSEREAPDDEEAESSWLAPIVWNNYHACTLSQTYWGWSADSGFPLNGPDGRFDAAGLGGASVHLDPAEAGDRLDGRDYAERAFHVYLLGHDACGDHRIAFSNAGLPGVYDVSWTGRIALAYVGDDVFRHEFRVALNRLIFRGLQLQGDVTQAETKALLERCVVQPERYRLSPETFGERFLPWT
jgi:hypothetical protein